MYFLWCFTCFAFSPGLGVLSVSGQRRFGRAGVGQVLLYGSHCQCRVFLLFRCQRAVGLRSGLQVLWYHLSSLRRPVRAFSPNCLYGLYYVWDVRASVCVVGPHFCRVYCLFFRRCAVNHWYRFFSTEGFFWRSGRYNAVLSGWQFSSNRFSLACAWADRASTSSNGLVVDRGFFVQSLRGSVFQRAVSTPRVASVYGKCPRVIGLSSGSVLRAVLSNFSVAHFFLHFFLPSRYPSTP